MNSIGYRIGMIIEKSNCKKVVFAERLKIDQSYVSQLVSGKRSPSERLIESICREFNVNRAWLETGEGEMMAETTSRTLDRIRERYGASEIFRAMLDVYATMTSAQQDTFEEYVNMLARAVAMGQNPATVRPGLPNAAAAETSESLEAGAISTTESAAQLDQAAQ